VILRDGLGERIGMATVFHPGEQLAALPHGETSDGAEVLQSLVELEDRLTVEFEAFLHEGVPLSVRWISVDQARELRKTHGARASETMLENEFLVLSHQVSGELLAPHAQSRAGMARTADFRWWGDRITLTVSVGTATAEKGETLAQLLERAQGAMLASAAAGGNQITLAPGRPPCSQS
jgi:hypothetical protein